MESASNNGRVPISVEAPGDGSLIRAEDADALELAKLPATDVRRLKQLGVEIEGMGTVTMDRGCAFINKQGILKCTAKLDEFVENADAETIHDFCKSYAVLTRAMADIIHKARGGDEKPQQQQAPRRTFAPNQTAVFASTVHIHEGKHEKEKGQETPILI